jgi:hypothetical protein
MAGRELLRKTSDVWQSADKKPPLNRRVSEQWVDRKRSPRRRPFQEIWWSMGTGQFLKRKCALDGWEWADKKHLLDRGVFLSLRESADKRHSLDRRVSLDRRSLWAGANGG